MAACAGPSDAAESSNTGGTTAPPTMSDSDDTNAPPAPRTCPPPAGVSARPESVEEVVALLGALPLPTSLPCFVESLERPLSIAVTTNDFSAQPADGPENPRMFIISGPLTMAIVPTGIGRQLLELAVDVGNRESLKAELEFPLTERVQPADPYTRIHQGTTGTTCGGCHDGERPSETVTGAFVSEALQPPVEFLQGLSFVAQHAKLCAPQDPTARCELLRAVFAHGETVGTTLPAEHRICRHP